MKSVVSNPDIIAHRGASGLAPENTLPAFHLAVALAAGGLELDVHLTRDGVLAIIHDTTLDRTTPLSGPVAEHTWAELQGVRAAGNRFDGRYPGARLVRLQDVIARFPPPTRFVIELKDGKPQLLVAETLEQINRHEVGGRTRLLSFSAEVCQEVRRQDREIELGILEGRDADALFQVAEATEAQWLHPHWKLVDPALISRAHDQGRRVNVWTVNDPGLARRMRDLGVEEITTDWPGRLRQAVEAR